MYVHRSIQIKRQRWVYLRFGNPGNPRTRKRTLDVIEAEEITYSNPEVSVQKLCLLRSFNLFLEQCEPVILLVLIYSSSLKLNISQLFTDLEETTNAIQRNDNSTFVLVNPWTNLSLAFYVFYGYPQILLPFLSFFQLIYIYKSTLVFCLFRTSH